MANSKIVDVSSHQGEIDWDQAKADGIERSIIRISLGYETQDNQSAQNAKRASAAGITVSYYHFAYPDSKSGGTVSADATNEAKYFASLFQNGELPDPEWLAVDLENWSANEDSPLNRTDYQSWLTTFLSTVKNITGKDCMIYGNKSYLDSHLPSNHLFGASLLWLANYNIVQTPPLPAGWTSYFLWQYSEEGAVSGINGSVDLSRTNTQTFV